jgi:hypothetical protein
MDTSQMSVEVLGAVLIMSGITMLGSRAGYSLFVIGIKSVVLLALIATAVLWYVSGAHAEEDNRTAVEKAFCAGIEIQRMTAKINITEIQDALRADGNRLYVLYDEKVLNKILGADTSYGSFKCNDRDIEFAPGMEK